jgi:hypothetical protein
VTFQVGSTVSTLIFGYNFQSTRLKFEGGGPTAPITFKRDDGQPYPYASLFTWLFGTLHFKYDRGANFANASAAF